ncbi:hypothetical protein [Candidatus Nucleicultrix amoebiphila]|jgi:hypothetical protein|uniref:Uncharacterized protein n=1 Tax=Candidatus Nucleicultrix amoebiphila FS5 TaxID=1414854 RepID=A0A1W6N5A9_9PROT|nr:hypothetical protein [Candidatus Nucleicultrix amoebiphila]ARN85055.1 hypothetical protein GQ61_06860 [Candidatus Nucleicultrix amoebiphila FS5]
MKKNLLLTSQDYGSGVNLIPLYNNTRLHDLFNVGVILSGPSCSLMSKRNTVKESGVKKGLSLIYNIQTTENIAHKAKQCIEDFKPDILMTGISGIGIGVDEAALSLCKGHIKTFSYQDYWGHLNYSIEMQADHLFVLDSLAAQITSEKSSSAITIAGAMKYEYYDQYCKEEIYQQLQNSKNLTDKYWVFVGQPLWHLESYKRTLEIVSDKAGKEKRKLFYIPHPAESPKEHNNIDLLRINFYSESLGVNKEAFTLNAEKMVTCYSSFAFDILLLKKILQQDTPDVVVLLLYDEMREFHQRHSGGLSFFPLKGKGITEISSVKDLDLLFHSPSNKESFSLDCYQNATEKIINCLNS